MPGPLAGVKVLEVATFIAMPSAGALLADLGAEVVKVEPPGGDLWRAARNRTDGVFPSNPMFLLDNRGKRAIAVDLSKPEGQAVVRRLAQDVDVFTTNLVPHRRERYGMTYDALAAGNPRLVYLSLTGYGEHGPDRDRLSFDVTAFWARSGILDTMAQPGEPPALPPSSVGDHLVSPLLAMGVLAALYERERSGLGQEVDISLMQAGLWGLGADAQQALVSGKSPHSTGRTGRRNPLRNTYRTADGRWFLLNSQRDREWPGFCMAVGRPDLREDPRFTTPDARNRHCLELVAVLEELFSTDTLAGWGERLDRSGVVWAPVQSLQDALADAQTIENGYLAELDQPGYGRIRTLRPPLAFSRSEAGPFGPAPEAGQHTEEVLLEAGFTWDEITVSRESGAIGLDAERDGAV